MPVCVYVMYVTQLRVYKCMLLNWKYIKPTQQNLRVGSGGVRGKSESTLTVFCEVEGKIEEEIENISSTHLTVWGGSMGDTEHLGGDTVHLWCEGD